jgi:signal transduction histidine kinase
MSGRRPVALAWALGALASAGAIGIVVLVVTVPRSPNPLVSSTGIAICVGIGFSSVGALIASRRPENGIGWIMIGIAICAVIQGLAIEYAILAFTHGLPGAVWAAWLQSWVTAFIVPSGLLLLLVALFPTGRSLSARWRWLTVAGVITTAIIVLTATISRSPIDLAPGFRHIATPVGVLPASISNGVLGGLFWVGGICLLLAGVVEAVVRLRRSTGDERQQMKWFVYVTGGTVLLFVPLTVFPTGVAGALGNVIPMIGFGIALPIACGVAILKHGLYEIDVVINKTVVYGLLAAFVTVVYVGIVVGIGAVVGSHGNVLLSIVATAIVAVSFQPVRERARRLANRLVYGRRATPYEVLSRFADRVGEVSAIDELLPQMARILGEGTGATNVGVWVRVGPELRRAATWPSADGQGDTIRLTAEALPLIPGASRTVAVREGDELLGALTIAKPASDPITPAEDKLVADLAAQAGLVLRNVRLIEELRASRQRLVAAQDEERRRIERNIHDGAQQQLVALAVKLSLAQSMVGNDADQERAMLAQLKAETQDALENLRDLARGIYPPLLADRGLAAALEAQARKSTVPVTVTTDGVGRYPQEAEAAVYFCALEALQNVAKYAGASGASVRLSAHNGDLRFAVEDDGRGFDAATTSYGTGLQGMADRLEALGGSLRVRSAVGTGTTIEGTLPVKHLDAAAS